MAFERKSERERDSDAFERALLAELSEIKNLRARLAAEFQRLAGDSLSLMLESRESAEGYISHCDPSCRCAALCVLMDHWGPDKKLARICEKMALTDPDTQVRCLALTKLALCYKGTGNARIGGLLATLAANESADLKLREAAYRYLFVLCGRPLFEWPPLNGFELLRDANWDFVAEYRRPKAAAEPRCEEDTGGEL
jgi:hypothetical protein